MPQQPAEQGLYLCLTPEQLTLAGFAQNGDQGQWPARLRRLPARVTSRGRTGERAAGAHPHRQPPATGSAAEAGELRITFDGIEDPLVLQVRQATRSSAVIWDVES